MKSVSNNLVRYLAKEKNFSCCDVYRITLSNGDIYRYAAYDKDIAFCDALYKHKPFKFEREQVKLQGEPSVDTLGVTIYCENTDLLGTLPFMKACHDGSLDNAMLTLTKVFFLEDGSTDGYDVFNGVCEISSAGGLVVKLNVKSVLQGLASLLPVRVFASQSAFTADEGVVTASDADTTSMLIPLKPSVNVLL